MAQVESIAYVPKHLKRWTLPDSYMGATWDDYYVFLGQHRDSDSLTRSNFICGLEAIGGETGFDENDIAQVAVIHEGHWAVGWVEWIAIHESNTAALRKADEIAEKLEGYPVVDEDHWSELEYNEACESWEQMSLRDRIALLSEAGESIFAARRDCLPNDDSGYILEYLRG